MREEILHKIEEILSQEEKILCELIEVNNSLALAEEIELNDLDAALGVRTALMQRLQECEAAADELGRRHLAPTERSMLSQNLKALCKKVELSEKLALAKAEESLGRLKKDAVALGQGISGLKRYHGPVSHLSRFTDQTG